MTAEVASGIRTSINRSYNSSSGSVSYKGELAISVTRESITTVAVTAEKAGMIVADVLATEVASAAAS